MKKRKIIIIVLITASLALTLTGFKKYSLYLKHNKVIAKAVIKPTPAEKNKILQISLSKTKDMGKQALNGKTEKTFQTSAATIKSVKIREANILGNTAGNIRNGGFIAYQDSWLYFSLYNSLYKSMPDEETGVTKLSDGTAAFINVVGDWIYYYEPTTRTIWKISINGEYKTKIISGDVITMTVYNDWLYYTNMTPDGNKIYRIHTDGSNRTFITEGDIFSLNSDGDWLCFIRFNKMREQFILYRINVDGNNETKLSDDLIFNFEAEHGWIYGIVESSSGNNLELFRMKSDGTEKKTIAQSKGGIFSFILHDGWIYYVERIFNTNTSDFKGFYIHKVKPNGSLNTLLFTDPVPSNTLLNGGDDWLLGLPLSSDSTKVLYRFRTDGSFQDYLYR